MANEFSSVDCAEIHNTRRENFDVEAGFTGTVQLNLPYANRYALMSDILSTPRAWPFGSFTAPVYARTCACEPMATRYTAAGQACEYSDLAIVTVTYSSKVENQLSESIEPTIELIVDEHKGLRWKSSSKPIKESQAPSRQFRGMNLVRTYYNYGSALPASLITEMGKCSDAEYTSAILGLTFPVQTLLYHPPSIQRTFKSDGTRDVNLTVKFSVKPEGWNTYWNRDKAGGPGWDTMILSNGDDYEGYPEGSFADFLS